MSAIAEQVAAARSAQAAWEATPLRERLAPVRRLRRSLAEDPVAWAKMLKPPQERTVAESLAAEVGPLADACRWLEKHAQRTLRPRRHGRGVGTVSLRVERKPHGVVLVIGAANYPLFLLAAPAIQALVAGNVAFLKPPPGGEEAANRVQELLSEAGGVNASVLLDSSADAGREAIAASVDHVVVTGSASTGRAVASQAAESLTPCTLECSGADAVVILPSADLDRVVDCLAWAMRFNSGATCIAPRRVIGGADQVEQIGARLAEHFAATEPRRVSIAAAEATRRLVGEALESGVQAVSPRDLSADQLASLCATAELPPIVLNAGAHRPTLLDSDLFAPVLTLQTAETLDRRVTRANDGPFALGASVFGPADEAAAVARHLRAGCVTINDLIAPTGDARVPFGGTGESGYGVTRGAEGLLAMTRPQAVVRRHGAWLPHLDEPTPALDDLLTGMIQSQHAAGLAAKWRGLRRMISAASRHKQHTRER